MKFKFFNTWGLPKTYNGRGKLFDLVVGHWDYNMRYGLLLTLMGFQISFYKDKLL